MKDRLGDLAGGLPSEGGCTVHLHVLEGEPAHELLGFTEEKDVDLLVAGSHGLSFVGRLLMGSVSTRLIRAARIPVLVIPPSEMTQEVFQQEEQPEAPVHPWVGELREFSRANVGRRTTLELDDPELGAQQSGKNFPLWGVDYDPKADRVNIMLGQSGTVEGHLTHSIPSPKEIKVEVDDEGRARTLQIRLQQGQIVLKILGRFTPEPAPSTFSPRFASSVDVIRVAFALCPLFRVEPSSVLPSTSDFERRRRGTHPRRG